MSVRLKNPTSPSNPAENVDIHLLIALVRRAYSLHQLVAVDPTAADGKFFALLDAFSNKLQVSFSDIAGVQAHLACVTPPDDILTVIPRTADGSLDVSTSEFRYMRRALHLKTGYAGLDCDKALRWADGDADRALARLIETKGNAATKV